MGSEIMVDDAQLLRQFAEDGSQTAFAELARRHAGWIFQASLRRTGERADLAQDVVQHVFLALAKHAGNLASHDSLAGWLFVTTRYAAGHVVRAEARRRNHEQAAQQMTEDGHTTESWAEVRPLLDQAMDHLSRRDRDALLQRYFEGRSLSELAARYRISEDGVRKRLDRALDKVRAWLERRGIASTGAALGALLASHSGLAAPPAIQAIATTAASSAVAGGMPAWAWGAIHLMNTSKAAWGIGMVVAAVTISSVGLGLREMGAARGSAAVVAGEERALAILRGRQAAATAARARNDENVATGPGPAVITPAARGSDARADGQAFLARYPAAQAGLTDYFRAQLNRTYALFYRKAGLSPAQIARFEQHLAGQWLSSLEISPGSMNPGQPSPREAELQTLLGTDALAQWQTFEKERVSDYFARNFALAVNEAAAPVTVNQMAAIMDAISRSSPEFRLGGAVDPATVDWTTALADVAKLLSPAQWEAAQPWLQKTYVDSRLKTLAAVAP